MIEFHKLASFLQTFKNSKTAHKNSITLLMHTESFEKQIHVAIKCINDEIFIHFEESKMSL
jgi:hypothetical protein